MSTNVAAAERAREGIGSGLRRVPTSARAGVGAIAVTQAGDVLTTLVALRYVPALEEANAVAAAAVGALGPAVVGLTLLALVAVGAVACATEYGVRVVRAHADGPGTPEASVAAVRLVGYGPLTALNVGLVVHNVLLVVTVARW